MLMFYVTFLGNMFMIASIFAVRVMRFVLAIELHPLKYNNNKVPKLNFWNKSMITFCGLIFAFHSVSRHFASVVHKA